MSTFRGDVLRIGAVLVLLIFEVPTAWALDAAPTNLTFNAVQGGANPASQIVNVSKGGNSSSANWKTSNYAAWLTVSPGNGTITNSTAITVGAQVAGLKAGTYTTTIKVSATKGGNVWIPVTFTVTPETATTSSGSTSSGSTTSTTSNTTATLTWTGNTETNLAGYKIHVGTASGNYSSTVDVRNVTTYSLSNLTIGTTYYFAVSAYDTAGNESLCSNEVSKSIY